MKREYKNPVVLAILLILALPLTNLIATTPLERNLEVSSNNSLLNAINIRNMEEASLKVTAISEKIAPKTIVNIAKDYPKTLDIENNEIILPIQIPAEVERLRKLIPKTIAEAEAEILPLRNRFLMWTNDLNHIMWGNYRNNIFVGKDNQGNRAWGLYGNGYFVGIYDGTDFFWGKYNNGQWKAHNLFGEDGTWGKHVLSPTLVAVRQVEELEVAQNNLVTTTSTINPIQDIMTISSSQVPLSIVMPEEVEKLADAIPDSYKTAEEAIGLSRNKFLMWTYDLKNIMWGYYGNIFFVGQDNQGKYAWGIFGDGIFAGKYDGTDFFWGKYNNGQWKAHNLFGKTWTRGRYVVYPNPVVSIDNNTP